MMHSANTSLIKASAALPKIRNPFTIAAGRSFSPNANRKHRANSGDSSRSACSKSNCR